MSGRHRICSGWIAWLRCVGMRITVYDVLSYLAAGMTHQEILEDFPYLTEADIQACLSYAADRERQLLVTQV
ncbi:MAG: DUF433 domain-containing protein [Ardenticatenaceae bacterium]|nr:DUF433 domain-containing protein [Ardenticatenaceae bacterium]